MPDLYTYLFASKMFNHSLKTPILLLLCLITSLPWVAFAQRNKPLSKYAIDIWTDENGLGSNEVKHLLQSKKGYLWVTSYQSISRFDGVAFTIFDKSTDKALSSNLFNVAAEGDDGTIFFGTGAGLVQYHETTGFTKVPNSEALDGLYIATIDVKSNNDICVGTRKGSAFRLKNGVVKQIKSSHLANEIISSIIHTSNGDFLIVTEGNGLVSVSEDGVVKHYTTADGLPSNAVYHLAEDRDGNVWIGAVGGLVYLDKNGKIHPTHLPKYVVSDGIDTDGKYIYVASTKGLYLLDSRGHVVDSIKVGRGLPQTKIRDIEIDNEGSIWLGSRGNGLIRLRDAFFSNYTMEVGLESNDITAVCELSDGRALVAYTGSNIINIIENGQVSSEKLVMPSHVTIKHLNQDSNGNIWVATYEGLHKISPNGTQQVYDSKHGFPSDFIRSTHEAHNGDIWVATRTDGLIVIRTDGSIEVIDRAKGIPDEFVMSISEGNNHQMLLSTNTAGVCVIDENGNTQTFDMSGGMPSNLVFASLMDEEGHIWAATNKGIGLITKDSIYTINLDRGMPYEVLYDIRESRNNLCFSSPVGFIQVSKDSLLRIMEKDQIEGFKLFNEKDGMNSDECTGGRRMTCFSTGDIYIPTNGGVAVFDTEHDKGEKLEVKLDIQSVIIDRVRNYISGELKLSKDVQRIVFQYTAMSLSQAHAFKFRYRLDKDPWNYVNEERQAVYTYIPAGKHTFEVQASLDNESWIGKSASMTFYRPPLIYEHPVFYIVLVIALFALSFLFYRQRLNRQLKWNRQLQKMVDDRTQEVVKQKEEIETTLEEVNIQKSRLENSYHNIRMLSDIGQEITALLSTEEIVATVYEQVKALIPTNAFGIGVYNKPEHRIDFIGFIEDDQKLPFHYDKLDDDDSLSDYCFKNKASIFINDFDKEYHQYIENKNTEEQLGKATQSVMFTPLIIKGKSASDDNVIGNITVQSYTKNSYETYHLDLFKNIATYVAIAIENARLYNQTESLLRNILPQVTAEELKAKGHATTKRYEQVSVLFTDFKGFTQIAKSMEPEAVVENLDYCFQAFDDIVKKHGLEKIKTIGDAYMCAGGIPEADDDNAIRCVQAGLEMQEFIGQWKKSKDARNEKAWEVRIGIHTGPIVAGVVGKDKFAYDIWGDTVNTASRMESSSQAGKINISENTYQIIKKHSDMPKNWHFQYRGEVEAKGKGKVGMYFILEGGKE